MDFCKVNLCRLAVASCRKTFAHKLGEEANKESESESDATSCTSIGRVLLLCSGITNTHLNIISLKGCTTWYGFINVPHETHFI